MAERGAVLFDLDDTLYPLEAFVLSGFRAVAADLHARLGVSAHEARAILAAARRTDPGHELQVLAERLHLCADAVPPLVDVIRGHVPDLRLPELTVAVLGALRRSYRLGLVTNGRPDIQARKIRALGLSRLVEVLVFAHEHGTGKPDAAPFLEAARQLGVSPARTVFVGDDLVNDMQGARAVGMHTIWCTGTAPGAVAPAAVDAVVTSLADVPAAVSRLLTPDWRAHVA